MAHSGCLGPAGWRGALFRARPRMTLRAQAGRKAWFTLFPCWLLLVLGAACRLAAVACRQLAAASGIDAFEEFEELLVFRAREARGHVLLELPDLCNQPWGIGKPGV